MKCHHCQKETTFPFKCPYCGHYFCAKHRLPENHNCPELWRARAPSEEPPSIVVKPRSSYEYTSSYPLTPEPHRIFWFSITELKHLTIGTLLVLSVALSLFFFGKFDAVSAIALAAVLTVSFLLHEIAHKLTAQRYGAWAEFRLNLFGVLITLVSIIFPLKIISPGAVMIAGPMSKETIGKTAVAGPLTNILLAMIFTGIAWNPSPIQPVAAYSAWINVIIALLNLIPFGIMDGRKIFWWNKLVWAVTFVASVTLVALTALTFINLLMF
ncbi:MAG: AN1-type zinc finger domain-containing protein [Thermoproteota archaeon]|nr:AN1-type zinc finger domain-containing protein [Thermoproteota archaeon]